MTINVSCVILAGGRSSRMGQDKAFLRFNGKTFLKTIAEKLSQKCNQLIISANKEEEIYRQELKDIDFEFVKDLKPYEGPLNAVSSIAEYVKNDFVFIATCDTPLLNTNLIEMFVLEIGSHQAVIPVIDSKLQPLNTLYTKDAVYKAKEVFTGSRSLMGWVEKLDYKLIYQEKIAEVDRLLLSYKSINTPEDYTNLISAFSGYQF